MLIDNLIESLNNNEYAYLTEQTGLSLDEIENVFTKFKTVDPKGLNRVEFVHLYYNLRPNEPIENINKIATEIFELFDIDKNSKIRCFIDKQIELLTKNQNNF